MKAPELDWVLFEKIYSRDCIRKAIEFKNAANEEAKKSVAQSGNAIMIWEAANLLARFKNPDSAGHLFNPERAEKKTPKMFCDNGANTVFDWV